jgi:hypothetical protein
MYEEFSKPIQELIKLMTIHYPHDFELVINTTGAEIRSTKTHMVFINDGFNCCCSGSENLNIEEILKMLANK